MRLHSESMYRVVAQKLMRISIHLRGRGAAKGRRFSKERGNLTPVDPPSQFVLAYNNFLPEGVVILSLTNQ